ncbi:hypothetical protein PAESOLCIP111_05662 [Paenibacillus solanacearum]|uniref:Uncharacterized protein n=1 Tax=Paenibacillus solanacearum TaxID=2048548 RepID=A0A916K6X6_9BACL|nr:hypothetical protein PAESOLCIP111_05662 [Paenibacillus solanacearum]
MYYPELMDISKEYSLHLETIIKFDYWLGKRDWTQRRGLRASQFVSDCQSDPSQAQILMIYAAEKKVLKKQYIFFCPYCTEKI